MKKCLIATVLAISAISVDVALAQVSAEEDRYSTTPDSPLDLPAPGVLSNDQSDDSLAVRLIAGPRHGDVALSSDGSLIYTPDPGFEGLDSLIYVAQVLRPVVFELDTVMSNFTVEADLDSDVGSDDDEDDSRAGGTISAYLIPHAPPYDEVHVTALDASILDPLGLDFSVAFGTIRLSADVEPGEMTFTMLESGGAVPADGETFEQPGNTFRMNTTVEIGGVQNSTEDIELDDIAAMNGTIEMNGTGDSLRMELPFEFEGAFGVSIADVDIGVSGIWYATAAYEPAEESAETAVLFDVGTITSADDPNELPTETVLHQAYPNPFNPQTVVSYELASESDVRLALYDVMGREVRILVDRRQTSGTHDITLEAGTLPSGIYLLRLSTESVTRTSRVVLAK